MDNHESNHLQSTARVGYISAFFIIILSIIYPIVAYPFIKSMIGASNKFSVESYQEIIINSNIFTSGFLPQFSTVILCLLFLITTACIYLYAPASKKIFALLSLCLSIMMNTLLSMSYFVQWTSLRASALAGDLSGLSQFAEGNVNSFMFAMLILSFHIFFSLSCLFLAPIFTSNKLEKSISVLFVLTGAAGAFSIAALITGIIPLYFVHDGLSGITILIAAILLIFFWRRIEKMSMNIKQLNP